MNYSTFMDAHVAYFDRLFVFVGAVLLIVGGSSVAYFDHLFIFVGAVSLILGGSRCYQSSMLHLRQILRWLK